MIKNGKIMYGTIKECVDEIWNMIDWNKCEFPDFDFCNDPYDDITETDVMNAKDGNDIGNGWYGCKANDDFDPEFTSINLIFGYYGGGWFDSLMMYDEDDEYKDFIIRKICEATDLTPSCKTVFEFIKGE